MTDKYNSMFKVKTVNYGENLLKHVHLKILVLKIYSVEQWFPLKVNYFMTNKYEWI